MHVMEKEGPKIKEGTKDGSVDSVLTFTCVVFIKKRYFLPHQRSEETASEPKVYSSKCECEDPPTHSHCKGTEEREKLVKCHSSLSAKTLSIKLLSLVYNKYYVSLMPIVLF